ncbi:MAG: hypothetical protein R3E01_13180 [Pirellulaceae bacterium]
MTSAATPKGSTPQRTTRWRRTPACHFVVLDDRAGNGTNVEPRSTDDNNYEYGGGEYEYDPGAGL